MSLHVSRALPLITEPACEARDPSGEGLAAREEGAEGETQTREERLRTAVDRHYLFVWRALRRFGIPQGEADDVAQEVFLVFARRLGEIEHGLEQRFLFRTAAHSAMHAQRAFRRRRTLEERAAMLETSAMHPSVEEDAERQESLALLDELLSDLPEELRVIVVLCELEEVTMSQAADILGLPPGTVASRLRRARSELSTALRRLQEKTK